MDIHNLTIKQAQKLIANKELSCADLVSAYLEKAREKNPDIHAYLEIFDDAMEQAEKMDKKIAMVETVGELAGIPFAIKDNMLIKGKIASSGSKILENYHATYDATVIKKLRDAGAIILGRANMDEFAMGSSTENSAYGVTKNPYDLERVAGGSSGGSAAALAMDGCLASLGSDTGGSIRQPAALCGVVGLKPTYGAVSRYGLMAMASSLDQIGPFAKTVEDAEIIFNAIKGGDEMDATAVGGMNSESGIVNNDLKIQGSRSKIQDAMKIGLLKYDRKGVSEDVNKIMDEAVAKLKQAGNEVEEIEMPSLEYALACYYIIMPAEVSSNLARFDGVKYGLHIDGKNLLEDYMKTRAQGFGKEPLRRIMLGSYVLSAGYYDAYYHKAQKVRALIRNDYKKVFEKFDVILTPTTPTPAFKIGEKANDPLQMYLEDIFTVPINLAGVPAVSIPAGMSSNGLPIGVQFIAPWFREDLLFKIGKQV